MLNIFVYRLYLFSNMQEQKKKKIVLSLNITVNDLGLLKKKKKKSYLWWTKYNLEISMDYSDFTI